MMWMICGLSLCLGAANAQDLDATNTSVESPSTEEAPAWTAITSELVLQVTMGRHARRGRGRGSARADGSRAWNGTRGPSGSGGRKTGLVELHEMGSLVERRFDSQNLSPEAVDLESRIKARREVLGR